MKNMLFILIVLLGSSGCEKKEATTLADSAIYSKIGKEPLVLEIGASNCSACIDMKKLIDKVKSEDPNLPIHIIDVYESRDAASRFKIKMIPTQIVLDAKGEEVHRHIGGVNRDELLRFVELAKKQK